jgi:hypothetical protein
MTFRVFISIPGIAATKIRKILRIVGGLSTTRVKANGVTFNQFAKADFAVFDY